MSQIEATQRAAVTDRTLLRAGKSPNDGGVNPVTVFRPRTGGPPKARDVFTKAGRPAKRKEARKALDSDGTTQTRNSQSAQK